MRKDAERFADDDKKKKELADAKNEADAAIWQVEKAIKDAGDKLPGGDKAAVEAAVAKVKEAKDGNDLSAIKNAVNNLHTAAHAMAQHFSRGGAEPPPPGGATPGGEAGKSDDVID